MDKQENNNYLKRGSGKTNGNVIKRHFYSFYNKHAKLNKLSRKAYDAFLKDLLVAFSEAIVKENLQLKLGCLGYLRVQAKKLNFFNKEGKLQKSLKVNWDATWKKWEAQYKDLTRDEIVALKNKKVVYFMNEHTNQEFYKHHWDTTTSTVKYHRFYTFTPSRQYSRLIKEVVTDPERKTYYYG